MPNTTVEKYKLTDLPQKSGTHRVMLYPGRHYVVMYRSRSSHKNWLTDAAYVGVQRDIQGEILVFTVPNGSKRRIQSDKIIEIQGIKEEPIPGQREQIVKRMQRIRAERHPETQTEEWRRQHRANVQAWMTERARVQAQIQEIIDSNTGG